MRNLADLAILVLLILVVRYLLRKKEGAREEPIEPGSVPEGEIREMVQDPECGVFIARHGALTTVALGQVHYFCSSACYRTFLTRVAAERNTA